MKTDSENYNVLAQIYATTILIK